METIVNTLVYPVLYRDNGEEHGNYYIIVFGHVLGHMGNSGHRGVSVMYHWNTVLLLEAPQKGTADF